MVGIEDSPGDRDAVTDDRSSLGENEVRRKFLGNLRELPWFRNPHD
jgi:hypothetical protein